MRIYLGASVLRALATSACARRWMGVDGTEARNDNSCGVRTTKLYHLGRAESLHASKAGIAGVPNSPSLAVCGSQLCP
jgi:hypothetical protein